MAIYATIDNRPHILNVSGLKMGPPFAWAPRSCGPIVTPLVSRTIDLKTKFNCKYYYRSHEISELRGHEIAEHLSKDSHYCTFAL